MTDEPLELQPPQALLPGMRRYVGQEKKDHRKWTDAKGQKIDAPKWRGRTSYGKEIPLPRDPHGEPYELGKGTAHHVQVMLRADGRYAVCDWSRPLGDNDVKVTEGTGLGALRAALSYAWKYFRWYKWQGPLLGGMVEREDARTIQVGIGHFRHSDQMAKVLLSPHVDASSLDS